MPLLLTARARARQAAPSNPRPQTSHRRPVIKLPLSRMLRVGALRRRRPPGVVRAVAMAVAEDVAAALVAARAAERLRPRRSRTQVPRNRSKMSPKSSWRDWLAVAAAV